MTSPDSGDSGGDPAWADLQAHYRDIRQRHLRDLFAEDPGRFERFSLTACGLFLDYSKHRITTETLSRLGALATRVELSQWIERMFAGEPVNNTEGRAALHVALRRPPTPAFPSADNNVMPEVSAVLERIRAFTDQIGRGEWYGFSGRPIRTVVNIGIGGSDLGPAMVTRALRAYHREGLCAHFVSNLDSSQLARVLAESEPDTTLFVVVSKTFGTQETLTNARSARQWLVQHAGTGSDAIPKHFVAVSANLDRTTEFGIDPRNVFGFWDWVGGRYSLWSAVGLSVAILVGMERFEALLGGARAMDEHFRTSPFDRNMPVLLGLLGVWYRNFFHTQTHAVLPYDYALADFPDYLQQLEMESNGKRVSRSGAPLLEDTCPIIWGAPGNNGQHAFYQLLHQGTVMVPSDFIVPACSQYPLPGHETALIANALAQTEALMRGRTDEEARAELAAAGVAGAELERQMPHRRMPGNQPTSTLVYRRLTPAVLGALIALYEHKVFVQSVCWGNNPFDQWGVELGKKLAAVIEPELEPGMAIGDHDASTAGLIEHIRRQRRDA